jgi:MHS family citrate/tricarballylate:H+ symporter-like MFS transporter
MCAGSCEDPNWFESSAPRAKRRHIFAATLGNALEFYDFITYSFFAIQIGHAFFPSKNAFASLMLSLATFGAGFLTRPIGGIVIGGYADRAGRRAAMTLSFALIGASVAALALIPTYAQIGPAAPVLAVIARMVQGFSLGGEVGPNTAYLLEAAVPHRRGLVVAWQGASQSIASVVGALVGVGLAAVMPSDALESYGWRIAFLLGAVTVPFGLILRRTMPETLRASERRDNPEANAGNGFILLRQHRRILVLGLLVVGGGTVSTYVTNYMTTFAQGTLHMKPGIAFAATLVPNTAGLVAMLFGGWLSDRLGRRPVMIWPNLVHVLVTLPIFYWIITARSAQALLGGMAVLSFASSMAYGPFYAALAESLPMHVRGRGFAAVYATAIALFGGTTQLMITWLIHLTGSAMAPGAYLLAANVMGLFAMTLIRESAPVRRSPGVLSQLT